MIVNELLNQLQTLQDIGFGDKEILYIDNNDIHHDIEKGVHDNTSEYIIIA